MSNRIIIELCEEDRKRLDGLFLMAAELVNALKESTPARVYEPNEEDTVEPATPEAGPEPVVEPEPAAEPELPKYTKEDILAKVQSLAGPNNPKREQAKAIVKSYGTKISDIPEDKYDEVMAKLAELEG